MSSQTMLLALVISLPRVEVLIFICERFCTTLGRIDLFQLIHYFQKSQSDQFQVTLTQLTIASAGKTMFSVTISIVLTFLIEFV